MASRPIVPQQARGEAVVGVNVQHKKNGEAAADGRNRRALGDIGNLVTVRGIDTKPQAQISRPMTRSFCAQLLANAQAAAAAENKKKLVCANMNKVPGAVPNRAVLAKRAAPAPKAIQKNVIIKQEPKPGKEEIEIRAAPAPKAVQKNVIIKQKSKPEKEEEIEIRSDTEKEVENFNKQEKAAVSEKKQASQRKKVQTLTSVLTARSKAACGLANKPKEEIVNIDAADANNDLAGVEYVEDIYKFYKLVENESRPENYMGSQPEINEKMRTILIDWLIDVHQKFELSPETLYLTVNIIDRFLSVKTVPRRELQLVGITATLMASKYEEIWPPGVNDLVCISDRAYSHEQVLVMEKTILAWLEWTLTVPTHYVFLARFIKASVPDKEMENMVYFLAELGMMHYDTILFCPSIVAASAVYAARCTLNKAPAWTETLKLHTGFSESQLKDCAGMLVYLHSRAAENKLQTVHRKYSSPLRGAVAFVPPAKSLLPASLCQ